MGARKGQNNFKEAQKEKVKSGKQLIGHILESVRKGVVFTDKNMLVVYVAEKAKMHRTTVSRNPEYMRLVLDYFGSQPGAAGFVSDEDATLATMRAKLLAAQARIKNLEAEIQRLGKVTKRPIGAQRAQNNALPPTPVNKVSEDEKLPFDLAFSSTAMALLSLLERLAEKDLGIALDYEKKRIVDVTEFGTKRIIAGPERTKWFFEWQATNPVVRDLLAMNLAEE